MTISDKKGCSLQQAQRLISESIKSLPVETVGIKDGLHRVTSSPVTALLPRPSFDESMRDGYVVSLSAGSGTGENHFNIVDEIPAGKPSAVVLQSGAACKIMTGGCVPEGGVRVIPYENCVEKNGKITVADHFLQSTGTFIRKAGSEVGKGDWLIAAGMVLQPIQLAQLASAGVTSFEVCRRPSVAFFCTGSELRQSSNDLGRGEKVSSNSFLLQGLLTSSGCCSEELGIIGDNADTLHNLFIKIKKQRYDLIISTGGMGPGKYDLVQQAFVQAGGRVIFSALDMRPGKSTLFGILGSTLFLGLPGPPHAVHTLLNLLAGPIIWALQGVSAPWPQKVQAYLKHSVKVKSSDLLRLKDGVMILDRGRCTVRFPQKTEVSNCSILLSAEQDHYLEGELIEIILRAGSGIKM